MSGILLQQSADESLAIKRQTFQLNRLAETYFVMDGLSPDHLDTASSEGSFSRDQEVHDHTSAEGVGLDAISITLHEM